MRRGGHPTSRADQVPLHTAGGLEVRRVVGPRVAFPGDVLEIQIVAAAEMAWKTVQHVRGIGPVVVDGEIEQLPGQDGRDVRFGDVAAMGRHRRDRQ